MTDTATATATDLMDQLFADYGDAWASHDADAIAAFHAADGIFHLHAGGREVRGRDAVRAAFAGFSGQFPDLEFVEQESCDRGLGLGGALEDERHARAALRHRLGHCRGRRADEIDALDVITVSDGRLTAKHTYVDWATALAQMGIGA